MNKDIIELLESAKKESLWIVKRGDLSPTELSGHNLLAISYIDQALALLRSAGDFTKEYCEMNDRERIAYLRKVVNNQDIELNKLREAPEQPLAGEFTAKVRLNVQNWASVISKITDVRILSIIGWIPQLCDRLDSAESINKDLLQACKAWMKVESEMGDKNPCPDLALRAQYRKQAVALTEAAIAKEKEG